MSKKKNISYLFSLALLLLAGCESNTATVTPLEEEAVEVRLGVHHRDYRQPKRH